MAEHRRRGDRPLRHEAGPAARRCRRRPAPACPPRPRSTPRRRRSLAGRTGAGASRLGGGRRRGGRLPSEIDPAVVQGPALGTECPLSANAPLSPRGCGRRRGWSPGREVLPRGPAAACRAGRGHPGPSGAVSGRPAGGSQPRGGRGLAPLLRRRRRARRRLPPSLAAGARVPSSRCPRRSRGGCPCPSPVLAVGVARSPAAHRARTLLPVGRRRSDNAQPGHDVPAHLRPQLAEDGRRQQPQLCRPCRRLGDHEEFALGQGLRSAVRGDVRPDQGLPSAEDRADPGLLRPVLVADQRVDQPARAAGGRQRPVRRRPASAAARRSAAGSAGDGRPRRRGRPPSAARATSLGRAGRSSLTGCSFPSRVAGVLVAEREPSPSPTSTRARRGSAGDVARARRP